MAISPRCNKQTQACVVALAVLLTTHPLVYGGVLGAEEPGRPEQVASELREGKDAGRASEAADGGQPMSEVGSGAESIRVSSAGTVEMHVANLPLSTVLETLSIQSQRNIIATPNVSGTVTAHLYDVTFEEALRAVLAANGTGYREVGDFIFIHTGAELAEMIVNEKPPATRIFPVYFCSSTDALAVVTPMLSESGSAVAAPEAARGLDTESKDSGGNSMAQRDYLAVRDRPDVLDRVEKTLRELDVPPRQVLVEATILAVTLEDENALGVDFTIVGGVDLELLGAISNAVTDLRLGELPADRLEQFNANVSSDVSREIPDGGLTIGVVKDNVGVFVRALESITDTAVLANPKVLALNRQRAQVIVGRRDGYLTTTVTETQAVQNVEFLETGTQLIFRPFIGNNGIVRLELHPEDSVGAVVNGLPSEQTTEVTTNVVVRDGQTILIGGLFREVTSDTRTQVPLLGNAPLIGPLFQGRHDQVVRQEIIILLTVHIVKDHEAYAQTSEEARQDIERIRVGLRRNMMWHSRERLAQSHYRKSLEHFSRGDSDRALWDIRMALHNDPRFIAAIELREEILEDRDWDDDGAATRNFIHRLIMEDEESNRADFGRPAPPFFCPAKTQGPVEPLEGESGDAP